MESMRYGTKVARPNEYNPFGQRTWSQGPDDTWSMTETLNPQEQAALDRERGIREQYQNLASSRFGAVEQSLGQAIDPMDDASRQRVEQAMFSRLNPQFERDEERLRTRLSNQGLVPGSEAYMREWDTLNRAKNDARQQAVLSGGQEQSRIFDLQSRARQMPLNELLQLSQAAGGATIPQYQSYGGPNQGAPIDLVGAGQNQYNAASDAYNAKVAQQNQKQQAMVGLATTAAVVF